MDNGQEATIPSYDYLCSKCKRTTLVIRMMSEGPPAVVNCEHCGNPTDTRVFGAPAIGSVPGAGGSPARRASKRRPSG